MSETNLYRLKNKTLPQEKAQIEVAKRNTEEQSGVFEPRELIEKALADREKVCVSWSGGRCSTVVLHMALQIKPNILVYHCNHGVHWPETVEYVKKITNKWNLNLVKVDSFKEKTFWDIVEEDGFPHVRKSYSKGEPRCCYWLKNKPLREFTNVYNIDGLLDGLRVAESRVRMFSCSQHGQFRYVTKDDINTWKYSPIAFWTTERTQEYVEEHGIPLNPLYEKGKNRVGCWPCTAFVDWREQLAKTDFKKYKFLMEKLGEQKLLEHFEKTEVEPCKSRG